MRVKYLRFQHFNKPEIVSLQIQQNTIYSRSIRFQGIWNAGY